MTYKEAAYMLFSISRRISTKRGAIRFWEWIFKRRTGKAEKAREIFNHYMRDNHLERKLCEICREKAEAHHLCWTIMLSEKHLTKNLRKQCNSSKTAKRILIIWQRASPRKMLTVDAIEVVRCKDCKYFDERYVCTYHSEEPSIRYPPDSGLGIRSYQPPM